VVSTPGFDASRVLAAQQAHLQCEVEMCQQWTDTQLLMMGGLLILQLLHLALAQARTALGFICSRYAVMMWIGGRS
jgi:hypothetical protein